VHASSLVGFDQDKKCKPVTFAAFQAFDNGCTAMQELKSSCGALQWPTIFSTNV